MRTTYKIDVETPALAGVFGHFCLESRTSNRLTFPF
jgi:hypothetical protein